jgi:hypothetical protein
MKENPKDPKGYANIKDMEEKTPWFASINAKGVVDILPIMTHSKGQNVRIQLPIHSATEIIATKIREKYPEKFRINLDVYKSMLYAGRQLFDHVFLGHSEDIKKTKSYRLSKIMEDMDTTFYDVNFVEEMLKRLLEGYLSQGQGQFSRDKILDKIEEIKPLLSEELQARCDNFIDDELDAEESKVKIRERIRKREYRERKKNIKLVEG